MKKTYQKPQIDIVSTSFQLMDATMSFGGNTEDITGGDAKDRAYEEDNEAFNVTGGEGMSTYGDLW